MKTIEQFCSQKNGYSRSITLRNKLVPIGKTEEYFKDYLQNDEIRSQKYPIMKMIIDEYHRKFIDSTLSNNKCDWNELYEKLNSFQGMSNGDEKDNYKKEIDKTQKKFRKTISEWFTKNKSIYDKLFSKGLLKEILPSFIDEQYPADSDEKNEVLGALNFFEGFVTYFSGFNDNRKNMYSEKEETTAISYRIVNENFTKFFANLKLFNIPDFAFLHWRL